MEKPVSLIYLYCNVNISVYDACEQDDGNCLR